MTGITGFGAGNRKLRSVARGSLLEGDLEIISKVASSPRATASAAATAEKVAEEIAEHVFDSAEVTSPPAGGSRTKARMAKTIIAGTGLSVREDVVGFGCLFELLFSRVVSAIPVRMVLHREPAVGAL